MAQGAEGSGREQGRRDPDDRPDGEAGEADLTGAGAIPGQGNRIGNLPVLTERSEVEDAPRSEGGTTTSLQE